MARSGLDVLVVGSLHLDIVVKAAALPIIDETARGSAWHMVCGGKGGNQACWAARLGARTAMISQTGDDDFGRRLRANLQACGVDDRGVGTDPAAGSGMSVAILNAQGEYGAVIVSGANLTMRPDFVEQAMAQAGVPRILVLQNEIDEAINVVAARRARDHGAQVLLNAAPARTLGDALTPLIDVLIVNRVEAQMMSGLACQSVAGAHAAARALARAHKRVLVTLGGEGLIVMEQGSDPGWIAPEKTEVVSAHGAGDCFVGMLAKSLAEGQALPAAAVAANHVASRFVGGQLGAPADGQRP